MESNAMLTCVAMANPKSFSSFHSRRLDGVSGKDNSHLSDTFYTEMLVCLRLDQCIQRSLEMSPEVFMIVCRCALGFRLGSISGIVPANTDLTEAQQDALLTHAACCAVCY